LTGRGRKKEVAVIDGNSFGSSRPKPQKEGTGSEKSLVASKPGGNGTAFSLISVADMRGVKAILSMEAT